MLNCLSCYSWVFSLCCGNESIHTFIHFSMCTNNAVTCRVTSKLPHTQFSFYFWWCYRTQAEDNDKAERSFFFLYMISAPLKGSSLTSNRVFVYSRERKWSKMANRVSQDCTLSPPNTCVAQRADTQSDNLLFIIEFDFPWDTARRKRE